MDVVATRNIRQGRTSLLLFVTRSSHVVLGALAALRHLPVDILMRSLDVTRLAVNAAKISVSKLEG